LTEAEVQARARAIDRLRRHGALLAEAFELPLVSIDPESQRVRRRLGICYADGRIRIRLHSLRSIELLKYSALVDTLCHELAHLRHFDHGRRFWALYRRILAYAKRHGIYRPGPEPALPRVTEFRALPAAIQRAAPRPRPTQLELF
jgi:predicted metal-dependent hydrolase